VRSSAELSSGGNPTKDQFLDAFLPTVSRAASFNLGLPFLVVDVTEDFGTHALVQLRRALRAAVELASRSIGEHFSIA
jgi:hypothetical protein